MATQTDFQRLADHVRGISDVPSVVGALLTEVRHMIDVAVASGDWANIQSVSHMLGGNVELLAGAAAANLDTAEPIPQFLAPRLGQVGDPAQTSVPNAAPPGTPPPPDSGLVPPAVPQAPTPPPIPGAA